MATIEITVSELHKELHEQLSEVEGESYDMTARDAVEELVHDEFQEFERRRERQQHIIQSADDMSSDE